jgi:hypothetical protein
VPKLPAELHVVSDGFSEEKQWRRCVVQTVRELHASASRGRTISLPNLWRIFDHRWLSVGAVDSTTERWRQLGRDFLRGYYMQRQPFTAWRSRHL